MKSLSPHVTIYKFPITLMSSITNRLTGLAMSGMFVFFGSLCFVNKEKIILDTYTQSSVETKTLIHTVTTYPIFFHLYGGLRHFIVDAKPELLTNKIMGKNSVMLFCISGVSSAICGLFSYSK